MAMESVMLSLGTPAPQFSLRDVVRGQNYSLDSFTGKTASAGHVHVPSLPLCGAR